jgi:hypothetical protein
MEQANFDNRLRKLSALVGNHDLAERFNAEYERLHQEIEAHNGPRYEWAARLRRLGDQQLMYLSNQWLKEDEKSWKPAWVM